MTTRKIGWRQQDMLDFVRRNAKGDKTKIFHIHKDMQSKRVALSLEKRGLIKVDKTYDDWSISLA